MNQINIDVQDLSKRFQENSVLADIIQTFEKEYFDQGQVICKVFVNGLLLSEDDEYRFKDVGLTEIHNLCFELEKTDRLIKELIASWLKSLPSMIEMCDSLSEKIRYQGIDDSIKKFTELIDACQYLVGSLESLKVLLKPAEAHFAEKWQTAEKNVSQITLEVFKAFETKDFVLLSDLIEYDLCNSLQEWQELLKGIQGTNVIQSHLDR